MTVTDDLKTRIATLAVTADVSGAAYLAKSLEAIGVLDNDPTNAADVYDAIKDQIGSLTSAATPEQVAFLSKALAALAKIKASTFSTPNDFDDAVTAVKARLTTLAVSASAQETAYLASGLAAVAALDDSYTPTADVADIITALKARIETLAGSDGTSPEEVLYLGRALEFIVGPDSVARVQSAATEAVASITGSIPYPARAVNLVAGTSLVGDAEFDNYFKKMFVSADILTLTDATGHYVSLSSVFQRADVTTTGNGGLDAGSVESNTWYYPWIAFNPTTSATILRLSKSNTAPTLPSGFTFKILAAAPVRSNPSGQLLSQLQRGDKVRYVVRNGTNTANLPVLASGAAGAYATPTWQAVDTTPFAPPTARSVSVIVSSPSVAIVAPNNDYGSFNSVTNPPPVQIFRSYGVSPADILLETSNIYWASDHANGRLNIFGWTEK